MAEIPAILKRLFERKKDWDYANIFIVGRPGVAVEADTDFKIDEKGLLVIHEKQAPNPFYGRSGNPEEPEKVDLYVEVDTDFITSVEFMKFHKIITKSSKIEVIK